MLDPEVLQLELDLGEIPPDFKPNFNVAPGQPIAAVRDPQTKKVELFKWGLVPAWAKDPLIGHKLINARSETIAEKPSFKQAFLRRRCLIPADGFYEWKTEGSHKQPYLFKMSGGKPFTFAGIWELWRDRAGVEMTTCAIITTTPNSIIANYHDRMPVILDEKVRWHWLEETPVETLQKILMPYPPEEMATPELVDPKSLYIIR
jgi:putative SOS response-associated peptidase YedK